MKIEIKPLSINKCFQGRRFKTNDYKNYEKELLLKLPKLPKVTKVTKSYQKALRR